jgi:hypothetical protein
VAYQYLMRGYGLGGSPTEESCHTQFAERYPASQLVVSGWSHSLDHAARGDWIVMIQRNCGGKICLSVIFFFFGGGGAVVLQFVLSIYQTLDLTLNPF